MSVKPVQTANREEAIRHYRAFMEAMGYDISISDLSGEASGKDTPTRAVDAYLEFLGHQQDWFPVTVFPSSERGIVTATNLEFFSLCCHHMLPYRGVAHIGYQPNGYVAGLSKLVRILDHYAHRLSIQEQITGKVATFIMEQLGALGCGVIIQAEHLCMSMRGVRRPGHMTVTSDLRGSFQDESIKREFISLVEQGGRK